MKNKKIFIIVGVIIAAVVGFFLWKRSRNNEQEYEDAVEPGGGSAAPGSATGVPSFPALLAAAVKGVARFTKCLGNLRPSGDAWQGKSPLGVYNSPTGNGQFESFIDWYWGSRAVLITLRTYFNKYDRNTILKVINSWAPSGDNNNPSAYAQSVAMLMNRQQDATLGLSDIPVLAAAISKVETGIPDTLWADLKQWYFDVNNAARVV